MFGKEIVEFGSKGLKELKAEVHGLETEIVKARKSNDALRKSMSNGTWQREAREIQRARTELAGLRRERDAMVRTAGRGIGSPMNGPSRGLGIGVGIGAGLLGLHAGRSMFGMASGMARQGFQGTAQQDRLDLQIDRMNRAMAQATLPIMERVTKFFEKIGDVANEEFRNNRLANKPSSNAGFKRDLVEAGIAFKAADTATGGVLSTATGTAVGAAAPGVLKTGARLGVAGASMLGRAGASLGAAALANPVRAGLWGTAGYLLYANIESRARRSSIDEATNDRGLGLVSKEAVDENLDLVKATRGMDDKKSKLKFLESEIDKNNRRDRELTDKYSQRGTLGLGVDYVFGDYKADNDEQQRLNRRSSVAERLMKEAKGEIEGPSLMNTKGAGERRSAVALYEELATTLPQLGRDDKNDELGPILSGLATAIGTLIGTTERIANALEGK